LSGKQYIDGVKFCVYIRASGSLRLLPLLTSWLLALGSGNSTQAQVSTLNVINFGARGDAVWFHASTVSNSVIATTTNILSSDDVGKTIELFGAGPLGASTNHQDLLATITNIVNGTNLYLSVKAGASSNNCYGVYGTNNAAAFQACIDAAPSNSVIYIPDGTYLLIGPKAFDPQFVMSSVFETYPSVAIQKGGLTIKGQSRTNTVLLGCGAWQLKGSYVYRGYMFALRGPVTNNAPLVFDSLTMDGGVVTGGTGVTGWPASAATGDGWDVTHSAVIDVGPRTPLHSNKTFRDCTITRWRGEQVKSVVALWDGYITITNCSFTEGNASGINFNFSHNIDNCYFENLAMTMEFYQGYASNSCFFQNCIVTNMRSGIMAINGALAGSPNPAYTIRGNTFYFQNGSKGIMTTPANNVTITRNSFVSSDGSGIAILLGTAGGHQGTLPNSNIVVSLNAFTNLFYAVTVQGAYADAVYDVQVVSNTASGVNRFAGGFGWSTNVSFSYNVGDFLTQPINSTELSGQWFKDDLANNIIPHRNLDTSGITNMITYAKGARHFIWVSVTNSVFKIDDSQPQKIPATAGLNIEFTGKYPALLHLSTTRSGLPLVLTTGEKVLCRWTNNAWRRILPVVRLHPPSSVPN